MRTTILRAAALCALGVSGPVLAQQLQVDCDAGDDLAEALAQASGDGLTWIAVEGTCVGDFALRATTSLRIEGRDATLASPDQGVVLRVGGEGVVTLDGFRIRGGSLGVHAAGPDVWLALQRCDLRDNGNGATASRAARLSVVSSEVHDNELGISCDEDARCNTSFATIRDNRSGLRIAGRSELQSFGSEITGNEQGGLLLLERSTANLDRTTLTDNGPFQLLLRDRSHASLQNGTALGGAADRGALALVAGLLSSVETSRFGDPVRLSGDVRVADSSYLFLDGAQVSGDVEIADFGRLVLLGSEVTGSTVCRFGGDAVCREGSSARISGCASARGRCSPNSADSWPPKGEAPEDSWPPAPRAPIR